VHTVRSLPRCLLESGLYGFCVEATVSEALVTHKRNRHAQQGPAPYTALLVALSIHAIVVRFCNLVGLISFRSWVNKYHGLPTRHTVTGSCFRVTRYHGRSVSQRSRYARISACVLFEVYRKTYRVSAVQNVGHVTSIRFRLCVGPEIFPHRPRSRDTTP